MQCDNVLSTAGTRVRGAQPCRTPEIAPCSELALERASWVRGFGTLQACGVSTTQKALFGPGLSWCLHP